MSGFPLNKGATVDPVAGRSNNEEEDVAFSTSGNRKVVLDETPAAPSRKSWLLFCKEKKELCIQAGGKLKKLCECCMHNKIRPRECTLQEVLDISSNKSSTSTSSTSVESCSKATIAKEENISLLDESFDTILDQIKQGEKRFQEKILNISFLSSISAICQEAEESGLEELNLPHSKATLAEHIMMLMAHLPEQSTPNSTLICAMVAVQKLSKLKPPLSPDVESGILRFALQGVFSMDPEDANTHSQALHKASSDTLHAMLKGLLEEVPTGGHLLFILEHINFWIKSRDPKERARAQKASTALLQHVALSPHFDDFDNFPLLGRHVAELALCLTDPSQDVSEEAMEGIMCLYKMLLRQSKLCLKMPCSQQWQSNKEMLRYTDACKVGQMFAKILNVQQRKSFLQTSLLAIHDPQPNIREAAVLLIYSLLGREKNLLGQQVQEVKANIAKKIHKLETCTEVTDLLQGYFPSQGNLVIEDIENTDEEFFDCVE